MKNKYFLILFFISFIFISSSKADQISIVKSADRLMNVFYQNCNASKLPLYDFRKEGELKGYKYEFSEYTQGKISYISDLTEAQKNRYLNCKNKQDYLCMNPPSYIWGGKGKINLQAMNVDLFHNNEKIEAIAKHPGLDCSGFINHIFLYANLKVDKNISYLEAADEIPARDFMLPLSCFNLIKIEKNEKVLPGDIIAWNKHIVMITKLGKDPFGINKLKSYEDCNLLKLNPNKATMIVINSKGANDPKGSLNLEISKFNPNIYGNLKMSSSNLTGVGPGIIKNNLAQLTLTNPEDILDLIQTACLAKFKINLPSRKIKIVRHKLLSNHYSENDLTDCSLKENEKLKYIGDDLKCN